MDEAIDSSNEPAMARSYLGTFADRLAGYLYGLPGETCDFTLQNIRVPVPAEHFADPSSPKLNLVELASVLFQPSTPPLGTILVRSPYGIGYPIASGHARLFAARGYQVLLSACRGTAGSTGTFIPTIDDVADGSATILWMRKQPWYTGRWAMLGGSYLTWAQWATVQGLHIRRDKEDPEAAAALKELKAMVPIIGPYDWMQYTFSPGGAVNPDMLSWLAANDAKAKKTTWLPPSTHMTWHRERMSRELCAEGKTLIQAMETYNGAALPEWFEKTIRRQMDLPECSAALKRLDNHVAVLVMTGWADVFLDQSMVQYHELKNLAGLPKLGLTVGPWGHRSAQKGQSKVEILQWLDKHLAPDHSRVGLEERSMPVKIYDMGSKKWLEMEEWPPKQRTTKKLWLFSGGVLLSVDPSGTDAEHFRPESSFEYDPYNPTPMIGSSTLSHPDGKLEDDSSLAQRADVLAFTTEPLTEDLIVRGAPIVSLWHLTSHLYADLSVRISDVGSNKRRKEASFNVAETYYRLEGTQRGVEPLMLTLSECAHTFRKGNKLRVTIAGGCHPKKVRNLGTGEDVVDGVELRSVMHTVFHGKGKMSAITLPTAA